MRIQRGSGPALCSSLLLSTLVFEPGAEASPADGKATTPEIRYNRDIRPIFSDSCFKCHGPDQKKAGLNLQNRDSALKPLNSGDLAVVPGQSAESVLIQKVASPDESGRMPP